MDILQCKYAQIFQKYIEKCFALRHRFATAYSMYVIYLFIFFQIKINVKDEIEVHDTTPLKE